MEVVHARGEATVADVKAALAGDPSDSTVRSLMTILERKERLRRVGAADGRTLYAPVESKERARRSAIERLKTTLFDGSVASVVATLLDAGRERLTDEELAEIERLVRRAREEGR